MGGESPLNLMCTSRSTLTPKLLGADCPEAFCCCCCWGDAAADAEEKQPCNSMTGRSSSSNCPQLPFASNQNCAAGQLDLHRIRTLELEPEPELAAGGEKKYLSAKSKIQLLLLVLFRHWAVYIWVKINMNTNIWFSFWKPRLNFWVSK